MATTRRRGFSWRAAMSGAQSRPRSAHRQPEPAKRGPSVRAASPSAADALRASLLQVGGASARLGGRAVPGRAERGASCGGVHLRRRAPRHLHGAAAGARPAAARDACAAVRGRPPGLRIPLLHNAPGAAAQHQYRAHALGVPLALTQRPPACRSRPWRCSPRTRASWRARRGRSAARTAPRYTPGRCVYDAMGTPCTRGF